MTTINHSLFALVCSATSACVLGSLPVTGFSQEPADVLWQNGQIVTVDSENTISEAMAIRDGRVAWIGPNKEAQRYQGQEQQVLEFYRNNPEAMQSLTAPLYEDKVIDFILELAKITDRTVSLEELLAEPEEAKKPAKKPAKKAAKKPAATKAAKKDASGDDKPAKKPAAKKKAPAKKDESK